MHIRIFVGLRTESPLSRISQHVRRSQEDEVDVIDDMPCPLPAAALSPQRWRASSMSRSQAKKLVKSRVGSKSCAANDNIESSMDRIHLHRQDYNGTIKHERRKSTGHPITLKGQAADDANEEQIPLRFMLPEDSSGQGIDYTILGYKSWQTLQEYCKQWDIKQAHLESIYSRFERTIILMEHPDFTSKPQFHASLDFLADEFMATAGDFVAQLFIQTWYLRHKMGLQPPKDRRCVDFLRLVIMSLDLARMGDYELLGTFWACVLQRFDERSPYDPVNLDIKVNVELVEEVLVVIHAHHDPKLKLLLAMLMEKAENLETPDGIDKRGEGAPINEKEKGKKREHRKEGTDTRPTTSRYLLLRDIIIFCYQHPPLIFPVMQFQRTLRSKIIGSPHWLRRRKPANERGVNLQSLIGLPNCYQDLFDRLQDRRDAWVVATGHILLHALYALHPPRAPKDEESAEGEDAKGEECDTRYEQLLRNCVAPAWHDTDDTSKTKESGRGFSASIFASPRSPLSRGIHASISNAKRLRSASVVEALRAATHRAAMLTCHTIEKRSSISRNPLMLRKRIAHGNSKVPTMPSASPASGYEPPTPPCPNALLGSNSSESATTKTMIEPKLESSTAAFPGQPQLRLRGNGHITPASLQESSRPIFPGVVEETARTGPISPRPGSGLTEGAREATPQRGACTEKICAICLERRTSVAVCQLCGKRAAKAFKEIYGSRKARCILTHFGNAFGVKQNDVLQAEEEWMKHWVRLHDDETDQDFFYNIYFDSAVWKGAIEIPKCQHEAKNIRQALRCANTNRVDRISAIGPEPCAITPAGSPISDRGGGDAFNSPRTPRDSPVSELYLESRASTSDLGVAGRNRRLVLSSRGEEANNVPMMVKEAHKYLLPSYRLLLNKDVRTTIETTPTAAECGDAS